VLNEKRSWEHPLQLQPISDQRRKEDIEMAESIFSTRGFPVMAENMDGLSAFKDEALRNRYFPRWRALCTEFKGYLKKEGKEFSSDWEKETGLDWKEWGKL
jgi:hypothetical protein